MPDPRDASAPHEPDAPSSASLVSPAAALARRLRADPDAARHLDGLRRTAYGRAGSDAPLVEVPAALRARTGGGDRGLPAPLIALLTEEARLEDEGRAILAREARAGAASADGAAHADAAGAGADTDAAADADDRPDPSEEPAAPPAFERRRDADRLAVAAVGALVLVGLVAASASGLFEGRLTGIPTATSSAASPQPSVTTPPRGQAMGTPDGRRGPALPDFSADPPVPLPVSEEDDAAALQREADAEWAAVLADDPDAVRPDVRAELYVPADRWLEQHAACLREAGVDVAVIAADDDARLPAAEVDPVLDYACSVRFPVAPTVP